MGATQGTLELYIMYSFQTNGVYEAEEHNFFNQRRDTAVKEAAHEKHDYYGALDK